MDFFTQITQFWIAILDILWTIQDVLTQTTDSIDSITFEDNIFHNYLGYVKFALGTPLYTAIMSGIVISIGLTVYKTFLNGVYLVKELLIKIGK